MGMNTDHLRSATGILRMVSIALAILTGSIGTSAYFTSFYNQHCHDLTDSFPPPPIDESPIITVGPITDNFASSTESIGEKDMAPVLWMERFSMTIVWTAALVSIILFILSISIDLEDNKGFRILNFTFHFFWTIFLIASGIFVAFATYEIDRQICKKREFEEGDACQNYGLKMSAAAFDILLGVVYGALSYKVIGTSLYEEV